MAIGLMNLDGAVFVGNFMTQEQALTGRQLLVVLEYNGPKIEGVAS